MTRIFFSKHKKTCVSPKQSTEKSTVEDLKRKQKKAGGISRVLCRGKEEEDNKCVCMFVVREWCTLLEGRN